MAPVVSTDYPILDVNWQPRSFGLLPSGGISSPTTPQVFRFEAATSLPEHRRCPYLDDFFIKCRHLQKPRLGAFAPLASSFLPCHQRQQWLPGGVVLAQMRMVVWALIALNTPPILVSVFNSVSRRCSSSRIACIRCQTSVCRQPSHRRPRVLLTTPYV